MQKVKPKNILMIVLAMLVFISMLLLINSQRTALRQAQGNFAAAQEQLQQKQAKHAQLLELKAQGPAFLARLEKFEQLMPAKTEQEWLLEHLEQIAMQNTIRLQAVRFNDTNSKGEYTEIPLQITLEGQYFQLLNMLTDLQNSKRAFRIDELTLARAEEQLSLRTDLTLSTFHRNN